jgi:hypothetical protein
LLKQYEVPNLIYTKKHSPNLTEIRGTRQKHEDKIRKHDFKGPGVRKHEVRKIPNHRITELKFPNQTGATRIGIEIPELI